MESFYSEDIGGFNYPCRCSNHNMKPIGDYCEICMLRSQYQHLTKEIDARIARQCTHMQITLNDAHEMIKSLIKRVKKLENCND